MPDSDLGGAVAAFHQHFREWDGKLTEVQVAMALSVLRDSYLDLIESHDLQSNQNVLSGLKQRPPRTKMKLSPRQNLDNINLLDDIIAALLGATGDGWNLRLKGVQGPSYTPNIFEERLQIAELIVDQIDAGEKYESARSNAMKRFSCGKTKASQAYSDLKPLINLLRRMNLSSSAALETFARARYNPKSGRVR